MKLVNCTLDVPKKFQSVVSSVVFHEKTKSYEVFANEGFMLESEYKVVEVYSKKRALEVIRNASKIDVLEVEQTSLDLDTPVVTETVKTYVPPTVEIPVNVSDELYEILAECKRINEEKEGMVITVKEGKKQPSSLDTAKKVSNTEITENAKNALISDYKIRIKSDFDSKSFLLFKSDEYRKYAPSIEFSLPYGKTGKFLREFKSDGKNFFVKSKGEFYPLQQDSVTSVFVDGNFFTGINAIDILKVAYSYHKKRSFLNSLRKTNKQGIEAILKQNEIAEQKRINALISKQFDNVLKSKIVHEFLVLGNSVDKIEKVYPNASLVLRSLNLTEKNKGNFSNLSNGVILGTLKRYKRLDLVKLFELFFYGTNNNVQRFKNVDGIPC